MPTFGVGLSNPNYLGALKCSNRRSWAKDSEGLIGGVFRTQKDALRFALFEAAGDSACVKVIFSPRR